MLRRPVSLQEIEKQAAVTAAREEGKASADEQVRILDSVCYSILSCSDCRSPSMLT